MNEQEAREKIKVITGQSEQQQEERKNLFEELTKEIEEINPDLGGMEELSAILAMPENEFAVLSPVFLDELEKSFNNVSDKLILVQAMNAAGVKVEDIQESYEQISKEIDNQLAPSMTRPKRDFLKRMMGIVFNSIADTDGIAKRVVQVPVEKCNENAKLPAYAHMSDAGADVYALEDITIKPGETKVIPIGWKMAIPYGYEIQIRPKSGRCVKTKLRVANAPATIDPDYRQEVAVIIDNIEPRIKDIVAHYEEDGKLVVDSILYGEDFTIGKGEKFAQLVLSEIPKAAFYEVSDVSSIGEDRGGGFGSTGLK